MKIKSPFPGWNAVEAGFVTINSRYPEHWPTRYATRRTCDAVWGREWTRPYFIVVKKTVRTKRK